MVHAPVRSVGLDPAGQAVLSRRTAGRGRETETYVTVLESAGATTTEDAGVITAKQHPPTLEDVYDAITALRDDRKFHDRERDARDAMRDKLATERHTLLVGQLQDHARTLSVHGTQIGALQNGGTATRPLWAAVVLLAFIFIALAYYDYRLP